MSNQNKDPYFEGLKAAVITFYAIAAILFVLFIAGMPVAAYLITGQGYYLALLLISVPMAVGFIKFIMLAVEDKL